MSGHEIDIVIERAGELTAVEVKSAQTIASDFFSGSRYWRGLLGEPDAPAALVYAGVSAFRRQGVCVHRWPDL